LGVFNLKENIVIIGSSSELAVEFIKICIKNNRSVMTISRNEGTVKEHLKVSNYLDDSQQIYDFCENIKNATIVFFNGYLKENRPIEVPNNQEIGQTDYINFQIPYSVTVKLKDIKTINKFVYISSIAAIKSREKNYIYGLSKFKLEKAIMHLNINTFLILRFGKIKTRMSMNHKSPPFTLPKEKAARILYDKLGCSGIVYGNLGLRIIANILKILPKRILLLFKI
jgi:dTDP-4-dehydrorhamnose reductase